jgi:hypothetical protein
VAERIVSVNAALQETNRPRQRVCAQSGAALLPLRALLWLALALTGVIMAGLALALVLAAGVPAPDYAPLLGEGACAAPCWHDIQPGETTLVEAVALLDQDPSVEAVVVNVRSASWWWNGDQAPVLRHQPQPFDGRMLFATDAADSAIDGLALMTTLTLGDLYLQLGPPHTQTFHLPSNPAPTRLIYEAHYDGLSVFATLACPVSPTAFWAAPAGLTFGEVDLSIGGIRLTAPATAGWPLGRYSDLCGA